LNGVNEKSTVTFYTNSEAENAKQVISQLWCQHYLPPLICPFFEGKN